MRFRSHDEEELEVNLTPLIDVVFLLLIFFMVSTTFDTTSELKIELPQASNEKKAHPKNPLIVMIDPRGFYYLDGKRLKNQSADLLLLEVHKLIGNNKDKPVVIQSDAKSPVQSMVTAMEVIGRAGIVNLSIATTQTIE